MLWAQHCNVGVTERVRYPCFHIPPGCVISSEPVNLSLLYIPCKKLGTFSASSQRLAWGLDQIVYLSFPSLVPRAFVFHAGCGLESSGKLPEKNNDHVYFIETRSECLAWVPDVQTFQALSVMLKSLGIKTHCPKVRDPGSASYYNKRDIVSWRFRHRSGRAG